MSFKSILFIIVVLLFISCEGITNEEEAEVVNNQEDQAKVDQLLANLTKGNYADHVSGLSHIYGNRINVIGFDSGDSEHILNKTFAVWPTNIPLKKDEETSQLRTQLNKYRSEAKRLKAKGKDISAFDVMLESEEADTTFSLIEQQFLKDVQKVFDEKKAQQPSYYESKLNKLKNEYQINYDLTDKELITIVGISESVSSFINTLHSNDHVTNILYPQEVSKAVIVSPAFLLLQTGGCNSKSARYNYTAPDCSFNPNWGEIGGAGAMGAATGFLGATAYMGYGAATGSMFGPAGSAAGAASAYGWGGFWGGVTGSGSEYMDQLMRWKKFMEEKGEEQTDER